MMPIMLVGTVAALLAAAAPPPAAQQSAAKPMANSDVLQLVRGGLSADIIVAAIKGAPRADFDVSPTELMSLKKAAVPDPVVLAMIARAAGPTSAEASESAPVTSDPNDPQALHEPGLYIDVGDEKTQLVPLEPAVFSQGKSGGFLKSAMTYGIAKVKWRAVVRSTRASQRTGNGIPTFYFYFENKATGLSPGAFGLAILGGATSPNEFVLAKLAVKKDSRELVVGEMGAFGGSSGARSEDTVELSIERLSPGVYRVRPKTPLMIGEYCFFYGGGGSAMGVGGPSMQRIFDFGVDASPTTQPGG